MFGGGFYVYAVLVVYRCFMFVLLEQLYKGTIDVFIVVRLLIYTCVHNYWIYAFRFFLIHIL